VDRAALTRIADCCRHGNPLGVADRLDLALAFEKWLAGSTKTMDEALGISRRRGERTNRTIAKNEERDALLRRCAQRFFTGLSTTAQARALSKAASRYEATAWRIDRSKQAISSLSILLRLSVKHTAQSRTLFDISATARHELVKGSVPLGDLSGPDGT
jgi:predicted Fe-S protein YdhL (DUF1289 family)